MNLDTNTGTEKDMSGRRLQQIQKWIGIFTKKDRLGSKTGTKKIGVVVH